MDPQVRHDDNDDDDTLNGEASHLLDQEGLENPDRQRISGSVAGVYSFCGGAGILLLTKLGGYLFDNKSPASPFVMMAIFNAILLIGTVVALIVRHLTPYGRDKATGRPAT